MSRRATDVLELLLPEAGGEQQARARKVVTCLRLLSSSASPRRATNVRLALAGARTELELATRERIREALADLVAHHLAAARSPESFLDVGTPGLAHDEAWRRLAEERDQVGGLAHVPAPGERPLEVVARLIACAQRLDLDPGEVALWRARRLRLADGARAGERAFLERLADESAARRPSRAAAALAGAVECLLDRGAVGRAWALLREHALLVERSVRLECLDDWVRLLRGDEPKACPRPTVAASVPPRLPAPLVALRRAQPEWLARLSGVAARGRWPRPEHVTDRGDLGAAVLAVFALGAAGAARAVHVDCAPALRPALECWLDGRDGACRRPGELERELVVRAEVVVVHAHAGRAPRGCLDSGRIRAAALAPVLDRDAELLGWLRLECEHHLLPSPMRLRALARAWRDRLRQDPGPAVAALPLDLGASVARERRPDPRADVLRALLESIGSKTAQRRWWTFTLERGSPRLVAEGGGALAAWRERSGGARALQRALVTQGAVRFDEPDPAVSLAADAASGLVVAVAHGGRALGLVVIESTRRRDVARLQPGLECAADAFALSLRVADFRAWHAERWGHDVLFDTGVPATAALAGDLIAAAAAEGPITLSGPAGAGKRVLARWLHHEAGRGQGPFVVHACGARDGAAEEHELLGPEGGPGGLRARTRDGTLVLDDPERLAPAAQARLERWLAEAGKREGDPRLVLTGRTTLAVALAAGKLREDLARRLQRLELFVPALAERREEIEGLVRQLLQRFTAELGRPAPDIADEAMALLWRQPWMGNLRELENVVYKLALCGGERVELAHVVDVAQRFRIELTRRVPPRQVESTLLVAALRSTRTLRGTPNKTRAALYLGWDPDTLARHLASAGLDADAVTR